MSEQVIEPIVEPIVEPVKDPIVEPIVEVVPTKNDLLRELSKEHGVNLFDVEGIQAFKEYNDSQKTDLDKKDEIIKGYEDKETAWNNEKLGYESKLKASELGIPQDKLDDALKLASGDPDKLVEVVKKYPSFKTSKGIKIGVTPPNNDNNPDGLSDAEKYGEKWADNPYYNPKI